MIFSSPSSISDPLQLGAGGLIVGTLTGSYGGLLWSNGGNPYLGVPNNQYFIVGDQVGNSLLRVTHLGQAQLFTQGASVTPLVINLASSQSANALEIYNSSSTLKFAITPAGLINTDYDGGFSYSSTHYIIPYNGGAGQYFANSVAGDTCIRTGAGKSVRIGVSTVESIIADDSATAGNTRLLVYDVDNGQVERVTVGAADSGGSGYKVLRIPN